MVVVKMADGLGNQIFRYVCGYAVSKARNEDLGLDIADYTSDTYRSFQMDNFNLDEYRTITFPNKTIFGKISRRIVRPLKYHVIHEQDEDLFSKKINRIYLNGYYEDLKFFYMCENDIRRQLRPRYEMSKDTSDAIEYCRSHKTCAVHLRLGDRRYDSREYFSAALGYIKERIRDTEFIVFSNEMEEAFQILKPLSIECKSIDSFGKFSDIDSFFILQSCKHQVLSVGTYGIWGGILNDNPEKIVCVPDGAMAAISFPGEWVKF